MDQDQLRTELERAYRTIRFFYEASANDRKPASTGIFYHSPVIASAMRFVDEDKLEGAGYFEGKPVAVMQAYLDRK